MSSSLARRHCECQLLCIPVVFPVSDLEKGVEFESGAELGGARDLAAGLEGVVLEGVDLERPGLEGVAPGGSRDLAVDLEGSFAVVAGNCRHCRGPDYRGMSGNCL